MEVDHTDDHLRPIPGSTFLSDGFYSEASVSEVIYDLFDGIDPNDLNSDGTATPDHVALGFRPIYDALVATRNTPAFTSIFSFLKALKSANAAAATDIDTLAAGENIGAGDGTRRRASPCTPFSQSGIQRRPMPAISSVACRCRPGICSDRSLTTDGGNKLLNRTLFRFHAPSRGCYVVQATSLQTGFLTVELNLRDVSANSTFQTKLIKFLEDGDYAVRVSSESAVRFGIRIDLLQRTEADCHLP